MKKKITFVIFWVIMVGFHHGMTADQSPSRHSILSEKQQADLYNRLLKHRLETIIPELMRREKIDLWLVINREYNEDPVYLSMVPRPIMYARRTSILIFHDRGLKDGVQRLSGSYYGIGKWYAGTWKDKSKLQFASLAKLIRKLNPKKIGINTSRYWAFGDGLSAGLKERLVKALDKKYVRRLVSAERLCVGWLETRSPEELRIYKYIAGIAHDLIREFFSNRVIIPDVTTADDVRWWIRQKITALGLKTWFHPSIDIIRSKASWEQFKTGDRIIRRGDLLHCDVGIEYLGLCTDMQWNAYVCRIGEQDAPEGLRVAMDKAYRLARIFMGEFKVGLSGETIVKNATRKAREAGLKPLIYTHPIGIHGHGAGPPMEGRAKGSAPEGTEFRGKYPLFYNTCYSIEFSSFSRIPEWNNQEIRIGYEEDAVFTKNGCRFIDGCQSRLLLIK